VFLYSVSSKGATLWFALFVFWVFKTSQKGGGDLKLDFEGRSLLLKTVKNKEGGVSNKTKFLFY